MTALLRYQPWSLHRDFFNEATRFFERTDGAEVSTGATAGWTPAVDIQEHSDKFVLLADVPGVDPASIEVTLEKGVLTLSGTRDKPAATDGVEARRSERASGRFVRRFSLPDTVDSDSVSARGVQGVLEIVIPKRPKVAPRKIAVSH